MKAQQIFIVILTFIGIVSHLNAANFGIKFPSFRKQSYELVGGMDETDPQLKKLLNKTIPLTLREKKELASLCLIDPFHCSNKNILQKISVNEVMDTGENFAYALYRQSKAIEGSGISPIRKQYSREIFRNEVILQSNLDLYYKKNTSDGFDLVLDILQSDDQFLITQMMRNSGFNPNCTYGQKQYALATMLILDQNLQALIALIKHNRFDPQCIDLDLHKPVYYLLKNYKENPEKALVKALLGSDINEWDLRGIGLSEPDLFEILFQEILEDDADRKIIFTKIIAQLLLWNEGIRCDENIQSSLSRAFTNDIFGYKIFINKNFTDCALGELNKHVNLSSLGLLSDNLDNNFWNKDIINECSCDDIPGLAQCPKCQKKVVLNTENPKIRMLNCKCNAKYLVGSRAAGGLLPLEIFTNLGQCSACGAIVDLEVEGNREINCTSCNRKSTWRPLEY